MGCGGSTQEAEFDELPAEVAVLEPSELKRFVAGALATISSPAENAAVQRAAARQVLSAHAIMTGDAGEDDSLLVSFIAYMINFGMSYVVWKWLTQSDYDDDEELHDDATWWAMIAANMLS